MYSSLFSSVVFILVAVLPGSIISFSLFCSKVSVACIFMFLNCYAAEIYPTPYRTLGLGVYNSVGKIASIFMPWVFLPAFAYSTFLPMYICAGFTVLAAIGAWLLPMDATGKPLDMREEETAQLKGGDDYRSMIELDKIMKWSSELDSCDHKFFIFIIYYSSLMIIL